MPLDKSAVQGPKNVLKVILNRLDMILETVEDFKQF